MTGVHVGEDDNGGGSTGPTGNGATGIAGEGGWYQRRALSIANLLVLVWAQEGVGVGRRRALSGGGARVLSGGRSGEVLASGKGPGGRGGDGDPDGVLHDDAAAGAAVQSKKSHRRRETLKLELAAMRRFSGGIERGVLERGQRRSRGSLL